jgi:hypothetical protein
MAWAFQPLLPGAAQQEAGGGGGSITLTADEGLVSLSGQTAPLAVAIVCAQGSLVLTGQAALFMTTLVAEAGTIAITGYGVPNPNAGAEPPSGPSPGAATAGSRNDAPRFSRTRWKR